MAAPVIYINGFPGVGKLTTARALHSLLPGSQILHNHELIDPVEKHCSRGNPHYQAKRTEYRQARLKPISHDPGFHDTLFIFTDSQSKNNECVSDYTDLALPFGENGGRGFYSVILHCEAEENETRLVMAGRGEGAGNGKLTDMERLREYRARDRIWKFEDDDEIEIDITSISAQAAAERIKGFIEQREKEGRSEHEW
ncbi:hypothetical protein LTR85_009691 [Meristemomyces frigidus]|nr:hypothetical protein LTR85_009691 [Meristemomyces frigidus]